MKSHRGAVVREHARTVNPLPCPALRLRDSMSALVTEHMIDVTHVLLADDLEVTPPPPPPLPPPPVPPNDALASLRTS
jgi:hypothetical protein